MPFKRIYHTGPVTELFCHNGHIFAGIGSQLNVYSACCMNVVQVIDVLPARVIHGIKLNEFSGEQCTTFCVYGQKCMRLVQFDNISKKLETVGSTVEFEDWIWDVSFVKDDLVCLTLGHNVIVTFDLKLVTIVSSVHCQEKCILYCAKFLCTSLDCVVLAAGTVFNQVVLWSTQSNTDETGRIIPFHRLTGHQGVIFSIDYDSRLERICSVSDDRSIRLYQLEFTMTTPGVEAWENVTSSLLHVLYGHSARVWDVRLLRSTFISVGEDSTCCVWSYTGDILQKFKGHKGKSIWSMCVDKAENVLVTGGGDNSVRLWHLNDEHNQSPSITSLDLKLENDDFPRNTQFLDADRAVIITNKGKLLLYNVKNNGSDMIMSDAMFSSYTVMAVSQDTRSIAIGNVHGTMRILEIKDICDKDRTEVMTEDIVVCTGKVLSILWLNTTKLLTTSPNGIVDLWNVNINDDTIEVKKDCSFELSTSRHRWVTAASLSHDGSHVVCGDRTGSLFLYQLIQTEATGKLVQVFPKIHGKGGVTYVSCHGNDVYTAGRDGTYRLFTWNQDKTLDQLQNKKVLKGLEWIENLKIMGNDDIQVLGFHSDRFVVWSIEQNQKLVEIECGGGHRSWDFTRYNNIASFVYVKAREVMVARVEMRSNQVIVKKCLHGRELCDGKFISVGSDATGNTVVAMVTCSEDTTVCLSFLRYDSCIPTLDVRDILSGHISSVRCLFVCSSSLNSNPMGTSCPDRKLIFSGGGRAQLRVWRVAVKYSKSVVNNLCLSDTLKQTHLHSNDTKNTNETKSDTNETKCVTNETQSDTNETTSATNETKSVTNETTSATNETKSVEESKTVYVKQCLSDEQDVKHEVCKHCLVPDDSKPEKDYDFSYECLGGLQLSSLTRKHWKPWRQPADNSDPETRIVDLSVISPESRNQPQSTVYVLSAACSDGIFRLLTFCETTKEIHLIASYSHHDHSILKTSHYVIPAPEKVKNQSIEDGCHEKPEEKFQPIRVLVISAATDGRVAFWDISDICDNVTTNPDFSSLSVGKDHSDQEPDFTLDVHQSGINSLYFGKYKDDSYILITGGDDNAVNINLLTLNFVDQRMCMSVRASGECVNAHSAQITGACYIPEDRLVTASIDQRICLWQLVQEESKIVVKQIDAVFTNVSDVSNIDVWSDNSGKQCILVSGNGLEVLQLDDYSDGPQSCFATSSSTH